MKKIIFSCLVASILTQMSMANSGVNHNHTSEMKSVHHTSVSNPQIKEVINLMHAPMMEAKFVESGNVNVDFLQNMIPHHEGAILSSKKLIQSKNLNPKLKKIAEDIIVAQEKEIKYFNELLSKGELLNQNLSKEEYQEFVNLEKQNMKEMMQEMGKFSDTNLESAYMQAMIAHHNGAIRSAKQILDITNNDTIKKIANTIISTQESEVKQFEKMLKR
ncbi:DUF305 domain-containing protein [Campylobacter helveticus]|uniref:DUF305 domain-containing protein n=1 Tax=Campylobacter helveticus TaxID=28898 RepID=UPI00214A83C8|nr:DUF305 domain-containing protein [Campylobacter helveticus]MCR2066655.1 DUF305 domain-containing protein [Campylobacter helveticus]